MSEPWRKIFAKGIQKLKKKELKSLYNLIPNEFLQKTPHEMYQIIFKLHQDPTAIFNLNEKQFEKIIRDFRIQEGEKWMLELLGAFNQSTHQYISEESKIEQDSKTNHKPFSILDFYSLIILLSKWPLGSKIDMLLILYDMQRSDQLNISEVLILIKSILRITKSFEDISDHNLEIFVEKLWEEFITSTLEKLINEKNKLADGTQSSESESFTPSFNPNKKDSGSSRNPKMSFSKMKASSRGSLEGFIGVENIQEK